MQQVGCTLKQRLTSFVANPLASSSKVQCLSHSQLSLMQVVLVHIGRGVHSLEFMKVLSIVGDVPRNLQEACKQQVRRQPASKQYRLINSAT